MNVTGPGIYIQAVRKLAPITGVRRTGAARPKYAPISSACATKARLAVVRLEQLPWSIPVPAAVWTEERRTARQSAGEPKWRDLGFS